MPTPVPDEANVAQADEATLVRPRSRPADTPAAQSTVNQAPINQAPETLYDQQGLASGPGATDSGVREVVRPAVLRGGHAYPHRSGPSGTTIAIVVGFAGPCGRGGVSAVRQSHLRRKHDGRSRNRCSAGCHGGHRARRFFAEGSSASQLPAAACRVAGRAARLPGSQEYNPQIVDKAERYEKKAEDISAQARAALAGAPREHLTNSNATGADCLLMLLPRLNRMPRRTRRKKSPMIRRKKSPSPKTRTRQRRGEQERAEAQARAARHRPRQAGACRSEAREFE